MNKEQEKISATSNLIDFKKILDDLGVLFTLDGGTLLGAYRDSDFCEDDHDDIDLTTLHDDEIVVDIIEEASAIGFEVYHFWDSAKKQTAQVALKRHGLKIDLMFKKTKRKRATKKAWWTVYGGPNKITYKSVPARFYEETKKIIFKGSEFRIPRNTEEYLELRYGNWREPIHRSQFSCYTNDNVIKKSYGAI